MNKDILKRIASSSRFQVQVFGGAVIFQGRILSPSEAESAGLLTYLLASQITTKEDLQRMQHIQKKAEQIDDATTDNIDDILSEARKLGFSPDALSAFHEQQNRVICQVIRAGSTDNGETFSKLRLVTAEEQQNSDEGVLWVGLLSNKDRNKILETAMEGHKEASKTIAGFRQG